MAPGTTIFEGPNVPVAVVVVVSSVVVLVLDTGMVTVTVSESPKRDPLSVSGEAGAARSALSVSWGADALAATLKVTLSGLAVPISAVVSATPLDPTASAMIWYVPPELVVGTDNDHAVVVAPGEANVAALTATPGVSELPSTHGPVPAGVCTSTSTELTPSDADAVPEIVNGPSGLVTIAPAMGEVTDVVGGEPLPPPSPRS